MIEDAMIFLCFLELIQHNNGEVIPSKLSENFLQEADICLVKLQVSIVFS